jgi:hypothetical protein
MLLPSALEANLPRKRATDKGRRHPKGARPCYLFGYQYWGTLAPRFFCAS